MICDESYYAFKLLIPIFLTLISTLALIFTRLPDYKAFSYHLI